MPKDLLIGKNSSMNTYIMSFFSIDCSTDIGSLFIKVKNKTFLKVLQSDKFNNDLLMKQILDFFNENKLNFGDISKVFVNQGPGNFSGLRGSLANAKRISLSKNLDLFGYNTFIWSCAEHIKTKDLICSLIKFREKYYIKKFDADLKNTFKVEEISENEIIRKYDRMQKVIPKKLVECFSDKILKLNNLSIVELDHNMLEFLQIKGLLDKGLIRPLYLN